MSSPRWLAVSKARTRFSELPLVDRPIAMSSCRPNAAICREKMTSGPTSLASALMIAVSLASPYAGSARRPGPGYRNSEATCPASVALPPLPNASSRPPRANRSAASAAHCTSRAPSCAAMARRSSVISAVLATVDRRTSASTAARSLVPEYRNG